MEREMTEVDVVVAGSGAAGMTAALTAAHLGLSILVIEKTGFFGGSTARSGGGLRTDERARVLRADGNPGTQIEGLYAAGNASASVMGHSYAGAGATIGPAMTFGYIAARTMAAGP
jgi:succinate dehydrogenase/fumarate reductase flavoprotein subunit